MFAFIRLLAVILLFYVACAQGGGGGRSGGSHSRSSSRSSYHSARRSAEREACKLKCTTQYAATDELKLRECLEVCDPPTNWRVIGGIVGAIGGVFGLVSYADSARRKKFFADFAKTHGELIKDFEISKEEEESNLSELARGKWEFRFYQSGVETSTDTFLLNLVAKAEERHLYRFTLSSSDKHGSWNGEGYIGFNANGTSLWLMKDYNDKNKARQTGNWSYLFYEGQKRTSDFEGKWWFKGYQMHPTYSGTFIMRKVKEE